MNPSKYSFLERATAAGLSTPATLFLSFASLQSGNANDLLNNFIDQLGGELFIVRSCVAGEDGGQKSMAGHFYSTEPVSKQELQTRVEQAFNKNQTLAENYGFKKSAVNLMVQPYIKSQQGGVLFSRWKYFTEHFVGEVSSHGAEAVVIGGGSDSFVLSKTDKFNDLKTVESVPAALLKETIAKLETEFDFPLDVEWLFDGKTLWVLQVRPVSRSLKALRPATKAETKAETHYLTTVSDGAWQINELAESLGELSPLSFSVLSYCYEAGQSTFQTLGFKAETCNFLARARNGQVYVNTQAYQEFFKLRAWYTPFLQSAKAPQFQRTVSTFCETYNADSHFSLGKLTQVFTHWQMANFYALKSDKQNLQGLTWPDEYEVLNRLNIDFPKLKEKMTWSDWRNFYKQWWLWEYEKLKKIVTQNQSLAFANIENLDDLNTQNRYELELPFSVIDFPSRLPQGSQTQTATAVVKGDLSVAPVYVVKNPKTWRGTLPQQCVLVAPYFDNTWVGEFDKLKGIVLEQGGLLSHSAIVAREKNVPYFIHWAEATKQFKTGDFIEV